MSSRRKTRLKKLFDATTPTPYNPEDKYVIISDQHKGYQQFDGNKELYCNVLDYYFQKRFKLILLGDVEVFYGKDITRFLDKYANDVYPGEAQFGTNTGPGYCRIWGNHDYEWGKPRNIAEYLHQLIPGIQAENVKQALKFKFDEEFIIFLTHGHQGELLADKLKKIIRFIKDRLNLEWIGYPTSASQNHWLRFKSERDYYEWGKENGVMLITGHTHRPRFESLDKVDRLEMQIESLCRDWSEATTAEERLILGQDITQKYNKYRDALEKHKQSKKRKRLGRGELLIPCYFNPGSCLHEKGISCLEISNGRISLVFHDRDVPHGTDSNPRVLEYENLDYIRVRIEKLTHHPDSD